MATPHVQRGVVTPRMATDYTTWRATSMNGVRTGGTLITIAKARPRTRPARTQDHPGCYAGGLGVTVLVPCAWLTASTTFRIRGTSTVVFVVLYQDPITPEPHAGVAEPSEILSRITADVQLDNGFPLMLGVATPKVAVYVRS